MDTLGAAVVGLLAGIVGSFIAFFLWPAVRHFIIYRKLRALPNVPRSGGDFGCRILNDSNYPIGNVIAYITIQHDLLDVRDPPDQSAGDSVRGAFILPQDKTVLDQDRLVWACLADGKNPMKIDIYSGEPQHLVVGQVLPTTIKIMSELGHIHPRMYLARKIVPRGTPHCLTRLPSKNL